MGHPRHEEQSEPYDLRDLADNEDPLIPVDVDEFCRGGRPFDAYMHGEEVLYLGPELPAAYYKVPLV